MQVSLVQVEGLKVGARLDRLDLNPCLSMHFYYDVLPCRNTESSTAKGTTHQIVLSDCWIPTVDFLVDHKNREEKQ